MNTGIRRKISKKKIVSVRDSNPHIWILRVRTQSYPLCYIGIEDNLIQVKLYTILSAFFTKIPEDG